MIDKNVYDGLRERVGARGIGAFLSQLARPYVSTDDLEAGYKALAADEAREREAQEWIEAGDEAPTGENVWRF